MKQNGRPANIINHVALVLDASSSMDYYSHDKKLIAVVDDQIKYLARRSKELDQETRVTVYTFADKVQCVIYDKDVLRLPSIKDHYKAYGNTALVDAAVQAIEDLKLTATKYGDHGFLVYVLTDGEENLSRYRNHDLARMIGALDDNWTVACLVPDPDRALPEAKRQGFPANNIAVWNTQRSDGVEEAGLTIRNATESYMTARATGLRGTRDLFSTGADAVNKDTVSTLTPMDRDSYTLTHVSEDSRIDTWIRGACGLKFKIGIGHYQLTKREKIQADKKIGILENATGKLFYGPQARDLIGLPRDLDVSVKPDHNKDYTIFVQSKAPNRKLLAHTKLLIIQ